MNAALCKMNWGYSMNNQPLNYRETCFTKYYEACDYEAQSYAIQNREFVYTECSKTIETVETRQKLDDPLPAQSGKLTACSNVGKNHFSFPLNSFSICDLTITSNIYELVIK